ncbi:thioredoxin family protein [Sphingobium sp. H39-3-25]|uniref:protein-disulfide reductase DsbD family protein n=1 Tax=Sphingobium arseniciresistens TaxID=3030834 RepID=UPI0023B9F286|nr:thioredoxin family protein [Sphingobium arseniciresistens]
MNRVLLLILALFAAFPAEAQTLRAQHYSLLVASRSASHAAGKRVDIAYVIHPDAGWHIYWVNPGDTGYQPAISWNLPGYWQAGGLRHPAPKRLVLGGYSSNVHEGRTILLQSLTGPSGAVRLKGTLDLLVCSASTCVPDPLDFALTLPEGDNAPDSATGPIFAEAQAAMPREGRAGALFAPAGQHLRVFLPGVLLAAGERALLFSPVPQVIDEAAGQSFTQGEGGLFVDLSKGQAMLPGRLTLILRIDGPQGSVKAWQFAAAHGPLPDAATPTPAGAVSLALIIGTAFLGGLFLNLMPCVFPILSLKALALARSGGDDQEARREALGYTLGAVGVILALGLALVVLRGLGHSVGWAFQLQDRRVLLLLLLLVTAIAVNLAGLFELPSLRVAGGGKGGFWGAAGTGALAAFIATPCTGPFMAGALGAAMVLPALQALAIFLGLGLGIASPFLLIGFSHRARAWLPRPGAWMVTLRRILSLPMFVTALGLAWVIGHQQGVAGMTVALALALMLCLGLWWHGLRQHSGKHVWPSATALLGTVAVALAVPAVAAPTPTVSAKAKDEHAETFSTERLASLRHQGKPVFLYLTADWCLTCKVNEVTSLNAAAVRAAFDRAGVTLMRGDWTNGDAAITAFLKANGKAGVPAYFWYPPHGAPEELPQILTPGMLEALPKTRGS